MSSLRRSLFAAVAAALLMPAFAQAQDGFLFRAPKLTVSLRYGAGLQQSSGDLYDFFTEQLTLEKSDFNGHAFAGDLGFRVNDRVDLTIGVSHVRTEKWSEFRDWVDQDDQPIEQFTHFERTPVTVGAKVHLLPRGRAVGQHAWVPSTIQPYVGAGAGVMFYRLRQEGDFVDHEDLSVFPALLTSEGNAPLGYVLAGSEFWVLPNVGLTVDGRYQWSSAGLNRDFSDYDTISLHGLQLTAGIAVRF